MVSAKFFGGIILAFAILSTFHWYFVHILNDMLVPELALGIFILYALGLVYILTKQRLEQKVLGIVVLGVAILISIHWYLAHLVKYFAGDGSQLIPELAVTVIGLYVIGAGILYENKIKVK